MIKKSILESMDYNENNFTKRILFKENKNTVFILNFSPGQKLPVHTHQGSDLFLNVIKGKGSLFINGQKTEIIENDAVYASGDEEFSFENTSSDPVSLLVTLCRIPSDQYAENIG